jgi:DNA-binding SARP family transcriptional activator
VRLLGRFQIDLPDGRIAGPWRRPSARRLVQLVLVLPGHSVGREEVAEILFPELAPARAANAVSKALTYVRSAVAPCSLLAADRNLIYVDDAFEVSVDLDDAVDALATALANTPGAERNAALRAALSGGHEQPLPEELYADWAARARDEVSLLWERAARELARSERSVASWTRVLTRAPGDEHACLGLMTAYLSEGRRDQAGRAYYRTVAALANDIGVAPSAAFTADAEGLLADADSAPAALGGDLPLPPAIGRTELVARVTSLLRTGEGGVLLAGPAGIGKTLVLEHVCADLRHAGWRIGRGAATPSDSRAPYAALRAALSGANAESGSALLRAALAGADEPDLFEGGGFDRTQLVDALAAFLDDWSRGRPALLVLDDLQWADHALRDLAGRLAERRRAPGHWMLLFAARSDEPTAPVPDLPSVVARIDVPPLGDDDIRQVIGGVLDLPATEAEMVIVRAAGNPFFALELARQLRDRPGADARRLPSGITALIGTRLAACPSLARSLAPLLALAGEEASYELILAVAADPAIAETPAAAMDALDGLVDAHLAVETPRGPRLAHPLIEEAALSRLNRIRTANLHARLAAAFDRAGAREAAARHHLAAFEAAQLSEHARAAARAGLEAGRRARRVLADEAALALLGGGIAALAATPDADRESMRGTAVDAWAEIGDIHLDRDDLPAAETAYRAGLELATTDRDRARLSSAIGGLHYRRGDLGTAVASYRRGLASLSDPESCDGARLESDLGWSLWRLGDNDEAISMLERASSRLAEAEPVEAARAFDRLAVALGGGGRPREAMAAWQRALALAEPTEDLRLLALLRLHAGRILVQAGSFDDALVELARAAHVYNQTADRYMQSLVLWTQADAFDGASRLADALAARDEERRILAEVGNDRQLAGCEVHRAALLRRLGRPDEANDAARRGVVAAERSGDRALPDQVAAALNAGTTAVI